MHDTLYASVCSALRFLTEARKSRTPPEEAERELRMIESSHPDVRMRLLWETESYDNSTHYDVLITASNSDTVSLSLSTGQALPWPLRGVLRWTEANLVQVNGRMLTFDSAAGLLDVLWNETPLLERLVNACLLREELAREKIAIDNEELQEGVDALRRAHGLFSVPETEQWMQERGLTPAQLDSMVSEHITSKRLRQRLTAEHISAYLESHMGDLDVARGALIEVSDEEAALRLHASLAAGIPGFLSAMHNIFAAGCPGTSCRFISPRRHAAISDIEIQLFAAAPGEVVGPIRSGSVYILGCLFAILPAYEGPEARAAAEQILFDEWLKQRRREAAITWHWGRVSPQT
jgi:putative peptide maturation system protein